MIIYSNDSILINAGALPYQMAGATYWFKWLGPGQYDYSKVDESVIDKMVEKYKNDPRLFIMDIEKFDLYGTGRKTAIYNMNLAANKWKITSRKIGWYGIVPEQRNHYWTCASYILTPNEKYIKQYKELIRINKSNYIQLKIDQCDFLCPSCYAFYKPGEGGYGSWSAYVSGLIGSVEFTTKQIIPIVWPIYHPSHGGGAIDYKEWNQMLEHISSIDKVDSLIIWLENNDKPCNGWRKPIIKNFLQ